ncbi:hypothetical protein BGZ65_002754 [Modicella reniformis]|uniref:Uncharacterized protein n=1 Tax=Modicella reniformis TaxID=1440133 RepID=A0A9P6J624_9FUNG|nr:hypothetical protein BGZ65_002754 [Modicella reniformis]
MAQEEPSQDLAQNIAAAVETPAQEKEATSPPPPLDDFFNIPAKSLAERHFHGDVDELGLPVMTHRPFGWTLPEVINAERWDLVDDDQSDAELENAFGAPQQKNIRSSDTLSTKDDLNSHASPFAAFLPGIPPQGSLESKEAGASEKAESDDESPGQKQAEQLFDAITSSISPFASFLLGPKLQQSASKEGDKTKGASDKQAAAGLQEAEQSKDIQSSDSDDTAKIFKGLAAVAAGGILAKVLHDINDSDDESTSSNRVDRPVQPSKSALQPKTGYSYTSMTDAPSSSDDGLTFDEGAGVGTGYVPRPKTPLRKEYRLSEDTDSEPSSPRFTAAQKGKQVDRTQFSSAFNESQQDDDDLPPLISITDRSFSGLGNTPLAPLGSPMPVSSPNPQTAEQRRQIYPTAPPGPWTSEQLTNKPFQRRSPASTARLETATTLSKDEQNLAFMSSARKQIPPTQPDSGAPKSLLTDFPDTPPGPTKVTAQLVVTLPEDPTKAPILRGQYELPSVKKIDQWKSKNSLAPNAFRRLLFNIGGLILSSIVMRGRFYRSVVKPLLSFLSPSIAHWTEWAITLLFLFNIAEVLHSYNRNSNNFEHLPLTPSQRTLLGLDPIVTKVPGAVPIFKKPTTASHSLTERPIMSTYVSSSQGPFTPSKTTFQKSAVGITATEYKDAATILNKSMSRSFNQSIVQDRADLERLMRNVEAREELQAEWKGVESDPTKRQFSLHSGLGASQGSLQPGVDMSADNATRPDLLASFNARGPITRYQPALRTTLSKDHTSKADLQKDGLYVVGHSKVLKNLKISEQQLDRWVFNMRKNVCTEMEVVDTEFAKQGLAYLDCKSATMFYTSAPLPQSAANGSTTSTSTAAAPAAAAPANSLAWGAASIATARGPNAFSINQPQQPQLPTSLQDLDARHGQVQVVKQRMVLEAYLAVPGYANRKYVIERLKAMGPFLTNFIWDSNGVTWDGGKKKWTPDLPTDAQIIMHLFTVFLDLAMPSHPSQAYDRFLFSHKHYVPMESKPDPMTALQIKQTSKNPPDYSLVVEGSMWEVVPKRLNLWYTLVMFVYMVMNENGGYIGELNIGTQMIGLGDVVEGYDI